MTVHRVSPDDFRTALRQIRDSFPEADVTFYEFPQLDYSPTHSAVLLEVNAWKTESFEQSDFFEDDPIHLTVAGHKRLAGWFLERIERTDKK